jgi:hypothetical protein
MTPSVDDAGPNVQTIFVRGIGEAKIRSGSGRAGKRASYARASTALGRRRLTGRAQRVIHKSSGGLRNAGLVTRIFAYTAADTAQRNSLSGVGLDLEASVAAHHRRRLRQDGHARRDRHLRWISEQ